MHQLQRKQQYRKGDILSVPVPGAVYNHVGVVVENRVHEEPVVVSSRLSKGGVVREHLSEFAGDVSTDEIENRGHNGPHTRTEVARRAEARIGESYNLLHSNCEHFVREVSGLESKSPQLMAWLSSTLMVALLVALAKS